MKYTNILSDQEDTFVCSVGLWEYSSGLIPVYSTLKLKKDYY